MSQKQNRRSFLGAVAAVLATPFVAAGATRKGVILLDAKLYEIWSDRLDMMLDGSTGEFLNVEFGDNSVHFQVCRPRIIVGWWWNADEEDRDVLKTVIRDRLRQWYGLSPLSPEEPWNPPSFVTRSIPIRVLRPTGVSV